MKNKLLFTRSLALVAFIVFLMMPGRGWGQTNPTTGSIPYTFTGASSIPSTMAIHRFGTSAGAIPTTRTTADGTGDLPSAATNTSGGFMIEGTSGVDGVSILASSSQSAGAVIVEVSTTGKTGIGVNWQSWTKLDQASYTCSMALQYRAGDNGTWIDVDNPTSSVYSTNSTTGRINFTSFSQSLPVGAENQSIVQVRWIYWVSGGSSGSRDRLGIDEINITSTASGVLNPASFAATASSSSQVNLTATANAASDNIVVVYNGTGTFTAPTNGAAPTAVGTTLDGSGGTIVYAGTAASLTNHTSLTANTAYYYKAFSYDATNTYSSGLTANATTAKIEPTNQVTNFTKGTLTTTTLPLTWTAAIAGSQLPDGYLLKLNTGSITDPVDATDPGAGSLAISSGAASYKVTSAATTTASFTSAIAGTMYNVKIYSYTNTGSLIDFKTTSVPTVNFATLPAVVTSPAVTVTGTSTANIGWTLPGTYIAGNHSTLVFIKATSAVTAGAPTNAPSTYTANTAFSLGTAYQGDAAAYCVYNGDGTSVSVTGLSSNTTYHVLIYTVVDASNSDATNSYSTGATANGTTSKIEPSNQPTAYAVGIVTTANIPLTWVAAVAGSQAPDGYLIKLNTSTVVDPIDGTDPADQINVSTGGGSANKKTSGTSYSSFTNWTAGTMYNFKIYSYTNSGTAINFNLTSPPSINHATLPATATGTSFTATGTTTANIAWTLPGSYSSGNHSTLVFVKAVSSITAGTPTNAPATYTASNTFASGTPYQGDAAAYCVYNGDAASIAITGLTANTAYYVLIYTVVDASNSNSTNSYSSAATPSGSTSKIEPTNQVTNFAVGGVTTSAIPLSWTAAVAGSQLPDGYLIKLSTAPTAVIDPVDGTDPANLTAVTGGLANKETTPGSASSATSFTGMTAGTMYNYKIYSYTNTGTQINFNLTTPPGLNHATLPNAVTGAALTATGSTTANISWAAATGYNNTNHSTLVFVKATSAVTQLTPSNAPSIYTANTSFGSGTAYQNDASASCVYNGDGTSVSISGLSANSTYHVLIYTVVDASNSNLTNSYSAATTGNGVTYKTAVTVPYSQNFETSTTEWTLATIGTNKWGVGTATNNGGTKALYISNDNGVSNAYSISGAIQLGTDAYFSLDLTSQTAASLSFDWKSNGEACCDYGEVYINKGGIESLLSTSKEFNSTTVYANKFISLTPYVGSEVTIIFRWVNDNSVGTAPPFAVDNVSVTSGDLATLTTTGVTSIIFNGASTGGNITNDGGSTVARGVCYGTSTNPTISGSKTTDGTGTGSFTSTLTGLIDNTLYYIRAYATNTTGTAYGNEISFTTSPVSAPTANAATSIGSNGFVANWNSVASANSYRLDVSTNPVFSLNNLSENFSLCTAGSIATPDAADISSSLDSYLQTTGWTGSKLYQAGGLFKFSSSSAQGYVITKTVNLSANSGNATLTFDLLQYGSDVGLVQVFHAPDGTTFTQIGSDITPPATIATQTINITGGTANSKVKISAKVAANNRFLIDNLSIHQNTNIPSYDNLNVPTGTSQPVSGLSPNTTYYYQIRAVGGNSTSANSNYITSKTGISIQSAASSNWNNTSTWNPSSIPTIIDDVTITATNPVNIDITSAACANLTIAASGILTINSNQALTVNGSLTNSATETGLVIESGASLLHNSSGISATIKRLISSDGAWHFISLPFTGTMPEICDGKYAPSTGSFIQSVGETYDFFKWNEGIATTGNVWTNLKTAAWAPNTSDFGAPPTFEAGKGYLVRYFSDFAGSATKSSVGTLANGSQSIALTTASNTYNLVGNPFPSTIDWKATSGWDRERLASGENLYIWNVTDGNYGAYSSGNSGDVGTHSVGRYIAPTQGFFVVAATAGNLTLDNNVRIATSSVAMKSNDATDYAIRVKVSGNANSYSDEILVEFGHQSNMGGVAKWWSMYAEAPSLYSVKDGKDYSISFLTDATSNPEISVNFLPGVNGNYILTANSDLAYFSGVTLIDLKTGISQDLKSNPSYNFIANKSDSPNRFKLTFNSVGINEPAGAEALHVYMNGTNLNIVGVTNANAEIRVTNMIGQVLLRGNTGGNTQTVLNANKLQNGVYVVSLISGSKVVSTKIVVSR